MYFLCVCSHFERIWRLSFFCILKHILYSNRGLYDGVPLWFCVVSSLSQVVLVFPGPGAVSVQDMIQCLHNRIDSRSQNRSNEPCIKRLKREEDATHTEETPDDVKGSESKVFPLQRVVFIDSTWNQTNKISTDERLQGNHYICAVELWLLVITRGKATFPHIAV